MVKRIAAAIIGLLSTSSIGLADGVCCVSDGSCVETTSALDCILGIGGVYLGDGSTCLTSDCTVASCCLTDGTCVDLDPAECTSMSGTPGLQGGSCAEPFCDGPPGACCLFDGTCIDLFDQGTCVLDFGGTFMGVDTTCPGSNCTVELEACCFRNGTCLEFSLEDCTMSGGTPQGPASTCATIPACTPVCPEDTEGDGIVGITDFLDVLAKWGPCPGPCNTDVDGDGEVGIEDFLAVLAKWGPCD